MEAARAIELSHAFRDTPSEVYSVRWNPDDSYLATASSNGIVNLYDNSLQHKLKIDCKIKHSLPLCCVRWRPDKGLTKNIILIASSEGAVLQYQATTGKQIFSASLPENQALCCDYSPEGDNFAVGWKDQIVRVYDDSTKQYLELKQQIDQMGHSNRVLSIKWPTSNVIFSAGWDNNVFMWDVRLSAPVKCFNGAYVIGDAMDVFDDTLVTVDGSLNDQLKIWSISQGRMIYSSTLNQGGKPLKGYTIQFSKCNNGAMIFVGGSGNFQGYFLNSRTYAPFSAISQMQAPIYTCDFGNVTGKVAIGTGDGLISEFRLANNNNSN